MWLAAIFEVGGDALIRRGMTGGGTSLIVLGFVILGSYGVVINLMGLDFAPMIGAYVGWFAVVSILFGRFYFGQRVSVPMWAGLTLVLLGSLVIQFGTRAAAPGVVPETPSSHKTSSP